MYFDKQIRANPKFMVDLITVFYDNTVLPDEKADVLEKQIAAQPTTEVLQIFIYLILFSVVMVIVALISAIMQNRIFFNIQNSTDLIILGVVSICLNVKKVGGLLSGDVVLRVKHATVAFN